MPLEEQYSLVMFCDVSNESEMSYQKGWLSIQSTDPFTYQACKSFDDVIVLKPDWVEAYIGRAFCWRIMEQQKLAKADFAMALRLDPERAKKAFAEYCELLKMQLNVKMIKLFLLIFMTYRKDIATVRCLEPLAKITAWIRKIIASQNCAN